ncbi:hypothetical protein BGW38_001704, partial [Lunasporangiospora selenospora]
MDRFLYPTHPDLSPFPYPNAYITEAKIRCIEECLGAEEECLLNSVKMDPCFDAYDQCRTQCGGRGPAINIPNNKADPKLNFDPNIKISPENTLPINQNANPGQNNDEYLDGDNDETDSEDAQDPGLTQEEIDELEIHQRQLRINSVPSEGPTPGNAGLNNPHVQEDPKDADNAKQGDNNDDDDDDDGVQGATRGGNKPNEPKDADNAKQGDNNGDDDDDDGVQGATRGGNKSNDPKDADNAKQGDGDDDDDDKGKSKDADNANQ